MIDEKKLKEKIRGIEEIRNCSLNFERAKELISKIQIRYAKAGSKKINFKSLVESSTEELELNYDYCLTAFSYFGSSNKKNKNYYYTNRKERNSYHNKQQLFLWS